MTDTTQQTSPLAATLDALGGIASGIASVPGVGGIGGVIAGVIGAGLRLAATFARAGKDPVESMIRMKAAVPVFLAWEQRSRDIASEFVGREPGDGE